MAGGVEAVDEGVLGVGVENPEVGVGRERDGVETRAAAVDEDEVVFLAEAGDALVEDTAGHAHEVVFGVAADLDDGLAWRVLAGDFEESEAGGQLDGGAAAEAGADGQCGKIEVVEALGGFQAEGGQRGEHALRVVGIAGGAGLLLGLAGEGDDLLGVAAVETALAVRAPGEGDADAAVDRRTEDRAAIIVGVITDEFDASGSICDDFRRAAKDFLKLGGEFFPHGAVVRKGRQGEASNLGFTWVVSR